MNSSRVVILGVAALAAVAAAMLARGLLGGGTAQVKAAALPPPATEEVLVAASDLQPGKALSAGSVRWEEWPKGAVDSSFITHQTAPDLSRVTTGAVVRAPLVSGEPLTQSKIVHADAAGIMAAMVDQGMRAVSIPVTVDNTAGGFILPNDRVDVILTALVSETPRRYGAGTLLQDVRVLAVDQTYEDKDQKSVLAKTATLEVTPHQAELLARAQATGTLSLALRALGDSGAHAAAQPGASADNGDTAGPMSIIRYGFGRTNPGEQRE